VGEDIDSLKHNTAISALMEFINEWSKAGSLSTKDAEIFLRLLAPFAPHISEELWQQLSIDQKLKTKNQSIHQQPWPRFDPKVAEEEMVTIIVQVNGKLRGQIQVGRQKTEGKRLIEEMAKKESGVAKYLEGQQIKRAIYVPGKLVNFVI